MVSEAQQYLASKTKNLDLQKIETGVYESTDRNFKYKLGIIDFLTAYNAQKKLETKFNNLLHWNDKHLVSC